MNIGLSNYVRINETAPIIDEHDLFRQIVHDQQLADTMERNIRDAQNAINISEINDFFMGFANPERVRIVSDFIKKCFQQEFARDKVNGEILSYMERARNKREFENYMDRTRARRR